MLPKKSQVWRTQGVGLFQPEADGDTALSNTQGHSSYKKVKLGSTEEQGQGSYPRMQKWGVQATDCRPCSTMGPAAFVMTRATVFPAYPFSQGGV